MTEWRLFDGDTAYVSTPEFHADRHRAAHLEDPFHRPRLKLAASFVRDAVSRGARTASDLGCGDGGLLSLIQGELTAWGYDFCPANTAGWAERGVTAEFLDVFGLDSARVKFGDLTCVTEVLEHLADPHGAVRWIGEHSRFIVASSPWTETNVAHDECHAWAFDPAGYRDLIEQGGFTVLRHGSISSFQVILGEALGADA
jgi:hypothetical protein